jgi:hypothetical protein
VCVVDVFEYIRERIITHVCECRKRLRCFIVSRSLVCAISVSATSMDLKRIKPWVRDAESVAWSMALLLARA